MTAVALIRPASVVARNALTLNATPPLSVAYLAASLAGAGHDVQVIDAVGEGLDVMRRGDRPDVMENGLGAEEVVRRVRPGVELLGVSCMFSHEWPSVRALLARLAAAFPGVPLVCGGEHATALPEFSLQDAPGLTACALGEGEETVVDLARAVGAGRPLTTVAGLAVRCGDRVVRTAPRGRLRALDDIPAPRWDLVPIERYLAGGHSFGVDRGRTMPLLASRGCPYRCTFCSSPQMWTTRYVTRSPACVVDEIEGYVRDHGVEAVDFYDLTAIVRREWVLEFCRLLRARRVPVSWQLPSGTRSEALDADVLRAMVGAGCRNVSYAPESGSPRTLERVLKKVRLPRMEASMRAAVRAGLNVKANVMIGFPDERADDLRETLAFIARMARDGVHDVSVWTFSPYPGSQLFDELRAAGRIPALDDDYFTSLLSYSNLGGAVSYDEHFSSRALERYRLAGMSLFYLTSYLTHPSRPLRSLHNVARHRYESRMEMALANLLRRRRASAAQGAA